MLISEDKKVQKQQKRPQHLKLMATGQKSTIPILKSREIALDIIIKDSDSNNGRPKTTYSPKANDRNDKANSRSGKTQRATCKKIKQTLTKNPKARSLSASERSKTSTEKKQQSKANVQNDCGVILEHCSSTSSYSKTEACEATRTSSSHSVNSECKTTIQSAVASFKNSASSSSVISETEPEDNAFIGECSSTCNSTTSEKTKTCETSETAVDENIVRKPDLAYIMPFFQKDSDGDTVLHLAVVQEKQALAQALIQVMCKLTLDVFNNMRQTPLHLAVLTHQPMMVKWLVEAGADVNLMDRHGQTSIFLACQKLDVACMRVLRDGIADNKSKVRLDLSNFQGLTALHAAVLSGNREIITLVLSMGANINVQDANSGRTALHHAVESNRQNIVELLLSCGASANVQTYAGNTPLHTATGRNMEGIVKLLVSKGADVNISNSQGDRPRVVHSSEMAKRHFFPGGSRGKKFKRCHPT